MVRWQVLKIFFIQGHLQPVAMGRMDQMSIDVGFIQGDSRSSWELGYTPNTLRMVSSEVINQTSKGMELGHPKPDCEKKKKQKANKQRESQMTHFYTHSSGSMVSFFFNSKCESFCSVIVGREIILFLCVETNLLHPF